ncbi:MAG TPA: hypothetical protein DDZ83_04305 [Nitrospinae bacterium]|nr:hypothetical protein [Nitrospinota bacterium]
MVEGAILFRLYPRPPARRLRLIHPGRRRGDMPIRPGDANYSISHGARPVAIFFDLKSHRKERRR